MKSAPKADLPAALDWDALDALKYADEDAIEGARQRLERRLKALEPRALALLRGETV